LPEEETFWILTFIIEELMPREYYTNMLSLKADMKIAAQILFLKERKLLSHLREHQVDLSLLMVESFLTLYTNTCHPDITAIIMDHLFIQGSTVLLKSIVLILRYIKEDLMKVQGFCILLFTRRYCYSVQEYT